eukprot:TRINITY_DN27028_c0_g1_i1.p1 TRINITY_DN27028_c0_g1~~TRINITY_DN27028_c0_g1_i1.p1  ORF type:complete len:204 (-),score=45.10 TRINITY_DN27028_c0_g1_i1:510-1121(-)
MSSSAVTVVGHESCFACVRDASLGFRCRNPQCHGHGKGADSQGKGKEAKYCHCETCSVDHACKFCGMKASPDDFQRLSDASSSDSVQASIGDRLSQLEDRMAQVEDSVRDTSDVKRRLRILEFCNATQATRLQAQWDQQIMAALEEACPNPLQVAAIMRHCGAGSKKEMNRHLYDMQERGLVCRTNPGEANPLWACSMQQILV